MPRARRSAPGGPSIVVPGRSKCVSDGAGQDSDRGPSEPQGLRRGGGRIRRGSGQRVGPLPPLGPGAAVVIENRG
eukprot:9498641-Pyramimonas_sp.AAC.1